MAEQLPVTPPGADGPQGPGNPPKPDHLQIVPDPVAQDRPRNDRPDARDSVDTLVETPPHGTPAVKEGPGGGDDGSGTDQGPHGRRAGRIVATVAGGSLLVAGGGYLAVNAGSDGGNSARNENPAATVTVPMPEPTLPGSPNGSITVPATTPEPTTTVKAKDAWETVGTPDYVLVQNFGYSVDQLRQLRETYGDLTQYWHQIKFDQPGIPVNHVFNFLKGKVNFDEAAYKDGIIKARSLLVGITLNGLDPFVDGSNLSATIEQGVQPNKERTVIFGDDNLIAPSWAENGGNAGLTDAQNQRTFARAAATDTARSANILNEVEMLNREVTPKLSADSTFGAKMQAYVDKAKANFGAKAELGRPVREFFNNTVTQMLSRLVQRGMTLTQARNDVNNNIPARTYPGLVNTVKLRAVDGIPYESLAGTMPFSDAA